VQHRVRWYCSTSREDVRQARYDSIVIPVIRSEESVEIRFGVSIRSSLADDSLHSESDLIALGPRQLALKLANGLGLDIFVPPMHVEPSLIIGAWHRKSSKNALHTWVRNQIFDLLRPLNEGEVQLPG
jgi:hypothetical protein